MNTVQNKYKPKAKVLVAEDDISIAKTIEYNLLKEGYEVYIVNDGDNVLDYAKVILPDVILVDWMLPGMQGTTICSLLRADQSTANTPIIMISSKDAELDKVVGLEHGADDYITKPISPIELAARIKAILRRIRPSFVEKKLSYSNIEIDLNACSVYRNGYELKLSPIEFQILHVLVEYPKKVFSREALIERIWGDEADVDERTIDVHITRLRKHLMKFGDDVIKTVRMIGYKLD
jgi:two-component system phosphate regulon response regulator PhoB